jgi:diguanylate cyclase (GGDEF)-like protein
MQIDPAPAFLLASPDPELLAAIEPVLLAAGGRPVIVLTAEAALGAMNAPHPLGLALLDENLPGMELGQLLVAARPSQAGSRFPIILIADAVSRELIERMQQGTIDDMIPRGDERCYWRLRVEQALRVHRLQRELASLRAATVLDAQLDRLTGVYNRDALLTMMFRETDRVQRTKSSLCLVLFDIDDFGHWNSLFGGEICDELLCQVAARTRRLLRSYDLLGRPGLDEFLVVLPSCDPANAMMLAERLRLDVFSEPFRVDGESIRLSACFGLAASYGRSPVVVLREAEQALGRARAAGPESIQRCAEPGSPDPPPVTFMSPSSGDELVAW